MANRFLLMKSVREVSILWLDHHGSCNRHHQDNEGNIWSTRFHTHRDAKGQNWAYLCPNGLSSEEWDSGRVGTDDPEGSWKTAYLDLKREVPRFKKRDNWEEAI